MTPIVSTTNSAHSATLKTSVYRGQAALMVSFTRFPPGEPSTIHSHHTEGLTLNEARTLLAMLGPQVQAMEAEMAPRVAA